MVAVGVFEGDAEPCGRWGADELDFAALGETVELGLRDEHRAAGAKDESGAGACEFLRRGLRVEFVGEKGEVKIVGFAIVQDDEAILGVQNFAERLMNAEQKLIKIGGFVERVNDVGNDLALFLHAANIGDVEKADDDGFDAGIPEMVLARDFEPAPRAVFALDAVVVADPTAGSGDEFIDAVLSSSALIGMQDVDDRGADEFAVEIAEDAAEAFAGVKDGAVAGEKGEEFACRAQQRGKLLSGKLLKAESGQVGWRALRHSIAA